MLTCSSASSSLFMTLNTKIKVLNKYRVSKVDAIKKL
jgi:hypothetical protein